MDKKKTEEVQINFSLEDYFTLNELARKEGKLLDEKVNEILEKAINEHKLENK